METLMTPKQKDALDQLMDRFEKSKNENMKCIICSHSGADGRGIILTQNAPAVPMIFAICYSCKQLPGYEEEVQRRTIEFLIEQGRFDLIPSQDGETL
jgi:hypothetical protein